MFVHVKVFCLLPLINIYFTLTNCVGVLLLAWLYLVIYGTYVYMNIIEVVVGLFLPSSCGIAGDTQVFRSGRRWYPIKCILSEFVAYLGEIGVLCVGNGRHFTNPYEHVQYNI